ncbi:MAG: serine/threonine protein kinase [Deltaproteobacteria bacterium]|nr:serine/threonine protein kinase [Deltaproteobacteria bacterium]
MAQKSDSKVDTETGAAENSASPLRVATAAAARPLRGLHSELSLTTPDVGLDETLAATPDPRAAFDSSGEETGAISSDHGGLEGKRLADRYSIVELIGRGGMGNVYLARHDLLEKTVAIKVLREELATSKEALSRFHREAVAAANIGDPHIVEVTDYGFTADGDAFLVMERLEGQDLRHLLRSEGALPAGRAVAIARQVLRALRAAHERGIVHRDLKAENIFLCQREGADFVKLLDFGISKLRRAPEGDDGSLTATGMVLGTPQYISPEQAHGEPDIDQRADIYAMGVILYEMLTGQLPFSGESAFAVMMKHVQEEPEPIHLRRPDLEVSEALEQVALKAMNKVRDDRYATAQMMLDALPPTMALTGGYESMGTGAVPEAGLVWRYARKWAALVLLVGLGVGAAVMLREGPSPVVVSEPGADARGGLNNRLVTLDTVARAAIKDTGAVREGGLDQAAIAVIRVEVFTSPHRSRIYQGKTLLGKGRVALEGPRGGRKTITIRASGHHTQTKEIRFDPKQPRLRIRLNPIRSRPSKTREDIKGNPYK